MKLSTFYLLVCYIINGIRSQTVDQSFVGCYNDGPNRVLEITTLVDSSTLTVESCKEKCSGYIFAGLEIGEECYCGNTIRLGKAGSGGFGGKVGQKIKKTQCSYICNGSEACGGPWAMAIYTVSQQSTTTTTTLSSNIPSPLPSQVCKEPAFRKDWNLLNKSEKDTFFATIKAMKSETPAKFGNTYNYDDFAKIHVEFSAEGHVNSAFFPWHRKMLQLFEEHLKRINPKVINLPYWNSGADADFSKPHLSSIFKRDAFGNSTNINKVTCVSGNFYKDWIKKYPTDAYKKCSTRQWSLNDDGVISPLLSNKMIDELHIDESKGSYNTFRESYEYSPHNIVHLTMGGDFVSMISPADPLFYLHHANVDRHWIRWQSAWPNSTYDGANSKSKSASLSDVMIPFNTPVSQVFNFEKLCYQYDESSAESNPNLNNNLLGNSCTLLDYPATISDQHILAMKLIPKVVREQETKLKKWIDNENAKCKQSNLF